MDNLSKIIGLTNSFFDCHWSVNEPIPKWQGEWDWKSSVPYHDKGGVYALFDSSGQVIYVGVGISKGCAVYKEHGISRRLLAHVITTDKSKGRGYYKPKAKWSEAHQLAAVGFPEKYSYLALALEDYLIRELKPRRNIARKKTAT
ncbi:hypothetical protein [Vibrio rhodolitus]|uniref:hypothetical protein n=1 Tax=Vibrio rhodolitus TaxID=2231649 RepID=UPI000E0AB540|nr:hypothetical protein [Vibrio rhodolitus]